MEKKHSDILNRFVKLDTFEEIAEFLIENADETFEAHYACQKHIKKCIENDIERLEGLAANLHKIEQIRAMTSNPNNSRSLIRKRIKNMKETKN